MQFVVEKNSIILFKNIFIYKYYKNLFMYLNEWTYE